MFAVLFLFLIKKLVDKVKHFKILIYIVHILVYTVDLMHEQDYILILVLLNHVTCHKFIEVIWYFLKVQSALQFVLQSFNFILSYIKLIPVYCISIPSRKQFIIGMVHEKLRCYRCERKELHCTISGSHLEKFQLNYILYCLMYRNENTFTF